MAANWAPVQEIFHQALRDADPDILDSAAIACGRSATQESADDLFPQIWPLVAHPTESVRRSAIMAIGLLGSSRSGPVLLSFLNNSTRSDAVTNSVAAIAMGYLSDPRGVAELMRVVREDGQDTLREAAIIALGLYRVDQREIVVFLLDRLDATASPRIPIALARLGEEASPAVPVLRKLAADRLTGRTLRRSCVIALGVLAPADDGETVDLLIRTARHHADAPCRGFALISLGRIAGRGPAVAATENSPARAAREYLRQAISASRYRRDGPWACLGCALAFPIAGEAERAACLAELVKFLKRNPWESDRGAAALALGLLGAGEARADLRKLLGGTEDENLRGFVALALGLLGDRSATETLVQLLATTGDSEARERCLQALAMLSPRAALEVLVGDQEQASTLTASTWTTRMLGTLGGPSALPHLIRLARNQEVESLDRAFAIVALGRIIERSDAPWNGRLALDSNYLSPTPAESLLLDIF